MAQQPTIEGMMEALDNLHQTQQRMMQETRAAAANARPPLPSKPKAETLAAEIDALLLSIDNGQLTMDNLIEEPAAEIDPQPPSPKNPGVLRPSVPGQSPPALQKKSVAGHIGNLLFWVAFAFAFFAVLAFGIGGNGSRNIFGYSFFEVLTTSMQREIPQGSLVLVKKAAAADIKKGDDITFLIDDKKTTVTHRVVSVLEDYDDSGQRGFQTQGVENPSPDQDIVYAENVVGRVVWHLPFFGQALAWMKENWWICLLVVGGVTGTAAALKILFKKEDTPSAQKKKSNP
ncbi:MAG: signal peptidase I [Oscillospiraceae bacterium]|nr:signal peptidase I [Oscillospiraceae bacterium]